MNRISYLLAAAAAAGAVLAGPAQADDPTPVCVDKPPAADFCLYVHVTPEPCVNGGGQVAGRRFIFAPCH